MGRWGEVGGSGVRTGLWAKVSEARKVLSSEKLPSSKTRRNSTPPFKPCRE